MTDEVERAEAVYRPWGTVTPEFWTAPAAGTASPQESAVSADGLRARLTRVAELAQEGSLAEAAALAAAVDEDVSAECGEVHLHTVQVREVRGYLAALTGDYGTGLAWYLHSCRLRVTVQGPDHPEVEAATRRAYSLWRAMPPGSDSHRLGADLLTVVTDIHGPDSTVATRLRRRLYAPALPSAADAPEGVPR